MHEDIISIIIQLQNKKGLHARAAAKIVNIAHQFDCSITLSYKNHHANAKNILEILMLAVACGEALTISAEGNEAQAALTALQTLIENKFDEVD